MSQRYRLIIPILAALALTGGALTYRAVRHHTPPSALQTSEAGVDAPREPQQARGARREADFSLDEYRDALTRDIYNQYLIEQAEQQARAVAANADARRGDTAIAADAIRRWGSGQLLLALPSIGVTAAVSGMAYERDGRTPATPNSPWGVAWYTFTSYPGGGGNAVFAGHVDWFTGAPAAFAGLRYLKKGDPIYTVLDDGEPVVYSVSSSQYVDPDTADISAIFGPTAQEAATFITCGGTWNAATHDYSDRLIVRAYRVR